MSTAAWVVHKFGGSSVADAACLERVARIAADEPAGPLGVVLSAARGVTDGLLDLVALAEKRERSFEAQLKALRERHVAMASDVLTAAGQAVYVAALDDDVRVIAGVLETVALVRQAAPNIRDLVSGYGEIWSTRLFARLWQERSPRPGGVLWVDARQCVVVDWGSLGPAVQWAESEAKLRALVPLDFAGTLVITGFIASDRQGIQTTLGRNGSDFSASIFGALLAARAVVIWTDVDGVLSADPRRVPDAKVIDALSYHEAMELAYFGAKVIHPATMAPCVERAIPIWIRNTFAPAAPGSLIGAKPDSRFPVKGITSIEQVALVNVEGAGMIGVPGTAQRLFGALRDAGLSVTLISQGSSEHSICFALPGAQAELAEQVTRRAFDVELRQGQVQSIDVTRDCAILAVVGDGMAGLPGVAAKVFGALGNAGVNVRAIAQGASERNISLVVDGRDSTRALRAVHAGFYLSPHTLSVAVLGAGVVGGAFLDQLAAQVAHLRDAHQVDVRVRAIVTPKAMVLDDTAIDLAHWRERLAASTAVVDLDAAVRHVHADHLPHAVAIDCTASRDVAARYATWLGTGIHVVTPNKRANSGQLSDYRHLQEVRRKAGTHYLYEATVGAGLPVIQTLHDLRATGDDVRSVEGILSGTLAYLCNVFDGTRPFSAIVADAKAKGYTEPDPRDDLSGTDVARKLIILGRELGLALELDDVTVESLVPEALREVGIDEFMARVVELDAPMQRRLDGARAQGKQLRYVGRLNVNHRAGGPPQGTASVGLVEVDGNHAFAHMALTDNVVRFATARYCDNPLIVQGPGAGPQVTAGGVFGDLLRLAAYLGATL